MTILVLHSDQPWLLLTLEELKKAVSQPIEFEHCPTPLITTISSKTKYDLVVCGISKGNSVIFQQLDESRLRDIPVLFISNSNDASLFFQSTRFKHSAFIVCPFQPLNLLVSLYQLCPELISTKQAPLTLKGPRSERIRVPKTTIQFIHSEGNYCFIYTDSHRFALKCSLKKMLEKLDNTFLQVHKRYCVNTQSILRIDWSGQQIHLQNKHTIPFGRNYRKDMLLWAGQSKQRVILPELYSKKLAEA
jgi:hypothetical protein